MIQKNGKVLKKTNLTSCINPLHTYYSTLKLNLWKKMFNLSCSPRIGKYIFLLLLLLQFEFSRQKSAFHSIRLYFSNFYNLSKIHWCFLPDWLGCCNRQKSKTSCLWKSRCDLKIEFLQKCISTLWKVSFPHWVL